MPYRGAHTPMRMAPGLISVVLRGTDVNHGAMLLRHRGITSEEHVVGQVKASCMCANSIIVDLMAKNRKHKLSGTRPTVVLMDEASTISGVLPRKDFVGRIHTMTTTEYTELRLALVAAVDRGHLLFVRGPSTTSGRIRDQLDTWGGMAINGWFFKFLKHRRPQETITQFVERQTKPTTKE